MGLDSIFKLSVIVNMIDNLSGPFGRMNNTVNESITGIDKLNQSYSSMIKGGALVAGAGAMMTNAVLSPVEATFETQKALGELGSVGIKNFGYLEDAATSFTNTWAGTSKAEFLTAAYDIKSGISSLTDESVAQFAEIAGITAKGTKATIEEMTGLFASGYDIYKSYYNDLSDLEFAQVFSAGIAKSVQQFKTTGSEMASSIEMLGASATNANVPLEEQLSILGMLQGSMSGSEAGTKYKAFLRSAAKAGEELELSFLDANNQLLSMPEILAQLRGKFGETMDAAEKMELQKAFGSDEATALIDLLYNKTTSLQNNIIGLHGSMSEGMNVATGMADAINSTRGDRYEVVKQKVKSLKESIGNQLAPTVDNLISKADGFIDKAAEWVDNNGELVKTIMIAALILGGFITTVGVAGTTIGVLGFSFTKIIMTGKSLFGMLRLVKSGFETLRLYAMYGGDAIKLFGGKMLTGLGAAKQFAVGLIGMAKQAVVTAIQAMPGLIASVWSFTAALLANPVTWIIIGIIALISAIILLWKNWDAVSAWITNVWNGFLSKITVGFTNIKLAFKNAIQWIKDLIGGAIGWFGESGKKILTTFTEGIKSAISAPVDAVKGALAKIRKMLPFSDAKEGPLSTLTLSGKRVFETINTGMSQTKHLPAETTEAAFDEMGLDEGSNNKPKPFAYSRQEVKKVSLQSFKTEKSETKESKLSKSEKQLIINKLIIHPDINKLKDLSLLFEIVQELKEISNGEENPDDFDNIVLA